MEQNVVTGLETISKEGKVPESRMQSALSVQALGMRLMTDDEDRSKKRAKVAGLVDGNAPYNWRRLREAGRGDAANVNFGTARSYLEAGDGAFYDLFSQAPGFVQIQTSHGLPERRADYSRIMSEQADLMFSEDDDFDNDMQLSQQQMVLNGTGPLYFENEHAVFPMSIESGDLLVPAQTKSKTKRWEVSYISWNYYPPELYEFIQNEKAATAVGWNIPFAKDCIASAMDIRQNDNPRRTWEDYQRELKTNSWAYRDDSKVIKVFHVFFKEFGQNGAPGRITHAIIERQSTSKETNFLFRKDGRYGAFKECVHPMYMDRGRGGYHHTVTGLGVKMYGPMEFENRLLCNLMDKAFAPKTLLKPLSGESKQKIELAKFGDYGVLPAGVDAVQNPIQGFLADGLTMFRTSSELMRSNLSSYRQPVEMQKPGNPETAFKEKMNASQQGAVSQTTFNRYYKQLDQLYREIIRRACNLNSTDERAKEYQKRCVALGVPRECFGKILSVKAVRVVGEGSPFMRRESVQALASVIGRCPEDGQNNWLNDFIASHAGAGAVSRYNLRPVSAQMASDQRERAMNQVADMRIGMPTTITATQNPLTFASTFLQAAVQAIQSVQKGANPQDVVHFLDLAGPACQAHIKRMGNDPLRKDVIMQLTKQLERVNKLAQQLRKQIEQKQQKEQQLKQQQQQMLSDQSIKLQKTRGDLMLKAQKQRATLAMQAQKHRQGLALADATTASNIHNQRRLAAFKE